MTPYFFVSNATGDDREYVHRFFYDLQLEIYRRQGYRPAYQGELARPYAADVPPATPWPAVLTCNVMVALYSEAYCQNTLCVWEWSLFDRRMQWHAQLRGRGATSLIGVRWSIGLERLQEDVRDTRTETWLAPGDGGLLQLMRDTAANQTSRTYRLYVQRIADLVIQGAECSLPQLTVDDLPYVEPHPGLCSGGGAADPPPAPAGPRGRVPPAPPGSPRSPARTLSGIHSAGIVLAVARKEEQPDIRRQRHFYGADDPSAWMPFFQPPGVSRPGINRPIYNLADERLAYHRIFDRKRYQVGSALAQQMEDARADRRVVILIMDPWLIHATAYSAFLQDLAGQMEVGYPVGGVVVYNPHDVETSQREDDFRDALNSLLKVRLEEIRDWNDLAGKLDKILGRAPNILMQREARWRDEEGPDDEGPDEDGNGDGPAGAAPVAPGPRGPRGPRPSDRPIMRRRPIGGTDQA